MFREVQHISTRTTTRAVRVALVGNPNTGKTTLFNELTGYRQRVGNYPGVTVEKKTGRLALGGGPDRAVEIIDLPGAYGFSAQSHDEMLVVDLLTGRSEGGRPDLIVAVVDAVNLRRNLFLASQVLELGIPVVVALNMTDLAEARGLRIDAPALGQALGVPVVPVAASKGRGVDVLKRAVVEHLTAGSPRCYPRMPAVIAHEVETLRNILGQHGYPGWHCPVSSATQPVTGVELLQVLLEAGGYGEKRLQAEYGAAFGEELARARARLTAAGVDAAQLEAEVRYQWIEEVMARAVDTRQARVATRSDAVDRFGTHPVLGLALLVLLMGAVFQSIYVWAGPLMSFIEGTFNTLGHAVGGIVPNGALQSLLVNGVIGGVGAVMIFLPQIMILFLFLAILEDCGYMARAAFLLDRFMGFCGLNGKAFIPLVSSFACAVPGIMTTRTIENRADRFVAILVAPLMSCSARLPVYVLLISAFVPARPLLGGVVELQTMVLIGMYAVGIIVAVGVALFLRRVVFKGESRAFLMELPSYKWPSPKTVLYRVYERAREFVIRAGTIIVAVSIVIWALGYYPRPASLAVEFAARRTQVLGERDAQLTALAAEEGHTHDLPALVANLDSQAQHALERIDQTEAGAYLRQSFLGRTGRAIEPVVKPLGWDWKIGTAVVAAFPAREVVIATLGTIYNLGEDGGAQPSDLRATLQAAKWPDGRPVFNLAVVLSIMVFFALCVQCAGTLAVIKRETASWRWPFMTFAYMTTLGYVGAFAAYRVAGWMAG